MRLPEDLQQAIERKIASLQIKTLKAARSIVSEDYRKGLGSHRAFGDVAQLFSYLAARMPATFGACSAVFQEIRARLPLFSIKSLLDLGAGPGSASWAGLDTFEELSKLFLVERESSAIAIGKELSENSMYPAWKQALWKQDSIHTPFDVPAVDLAVLSYSYGELESSARRSLIELLWSRQIPLVAVIEPGTPKGFEKIHSLREFILQKKAHLIAPCPHGHACPMSGGDWCHFMARIERSRVHRQLKNGTLGFEDEKFSYLVYAHPKLNLPITPITGRVIRSPRKGSGHVRLSLCGAQGSLEEKVITRSHREQYRDARDAEWGSAWL